MNKRGLLALGGTALGVGAGLAAQHSMIKRRRRTDPEGGERFGSRRGVRTNSIALPDGASIFVEEVGPNSRSGAVFIHGSCLRTDTWHYQFDGIPGHRLVFYDLRGHGLSQPKGDAPYTIETLGDDLERVIETAGLDEVVLVGHSVGGMIALDLCHRKPALLGGLVKGAVLLNTTHRPAIETLVGGASVARVERLLRRPFDAVGSRADYIERLRSVLKPSDAIFMAVSLAAFGPHASAKQIDFTYDMLAETQADVIFDLIRAYRDFDVTDVLGNINIPVLVVGGTHDRLTISKASEHMAESLPKAELKLLDGCGHMSMLERHREVDRLITRFLDDVIGSVKDERTVT
ncbi:MAG TPA: alpha/beta hydrolase [Actinomycetota bacterium]|nr:alpha/beta hydrolase [Actinomycetota bacterium]